MTPTPMPPPTRLHANAADLTGEVFGGLVALSPAGASKRRSGGGMRWLCRCACGETTMRTTSELRYRQKRGIYQMCRPCAQTSRTKALLAGRVSSAFCREAWFDLFAKTGSLYTTRATVRLEEEVRDALEEELGPPRRGFEWEIMSRETGFGEDLSSSAPLAASQPWDWFEQAEETETEPRGLVRPYELESRRKRAERFRSRGAAPRKSA